jgi:hypothetical protein
MATNEFTHPEAGSLTRSGPYKPGSVAWIGSLVALGIVTAGVVVGPRLLALSANQVAAMAPPVVAVGAPLQRDIDKRLEFLGQLSAVNQVELRAQVGGTLTQIGFKDGDVVHGHVAKLVEIGVAASGGMKLPRQAARSMH